jgi:hypothetical protein
MSVSNYTLNQRISNLQYQINKLQNEYNLLQNEIIQPTLIYSSMAIYGNGTEPSTSLNIRNNYNYSGWYFLNFSATNYINTNYINWSFPVKTNTKVSDLKGISFSFFNGNTTSNDDILYIKINAMNGSITYIFDPTITPTINTNYQGVCIIDKLFIPYNNETQIQYKPSTITGNYTQTDILSNVMIGTYSSPNAVQLVINKINLIYSNNVTQSYLLVSP